MDISEWNLDAQFYLLITQGPSATYDVNLTGLNMQSLSPIKISVVEMAEYMVL